MVFKLTHRKDGWYYVWEWCKDIWYSNIVYPAINDEQFENDVKIYGIQTWENEKYQYSRFENDVKIYGIQTYFYGAGNEISLRMM